MGAAINPSAYNDNETGSYHPSSQFLAFLDGEIAQAEDSHKHLNAEYDATVYERFERSFIDLRKQFKDKLQVISNQDHAFLNHSNERKQATAHILECATAVAQRFQEARETKRLDRPKVTDALEDLINAMKNLKELSERVAKE